MGAPLLPHLGLFGQALPSLFTVACRRAGTGRRDILAGPYQGAGPTDRCRSRSLHGLGVETGKVVRRQGGEVVT